MKKNAVALFSSPLQLNNILSFLDLGRSGWSRNDCAYVFVASKVESSNQRVEEIGQSENLEPFFLLPALLPRSDEDKVENDATQLEYDARVIELCERLRDQAEGSPRVLLGDARPYVFACIVHELGATDLALVDDGSITHEYMAAREHGTAVPTRTPKRFFSALARHLTKLQPAAYGALSVHTIYPCRGHFNDRVIYKPIQDQEEQGEYRLLADEVWVVGTNHVENRIARDKGYARALQQIVDYYPRDKRFVYFPHRREDPEKVQTLAFLFNFEVRQPPHGIEAYVTATRTLPLHLACTFSTVVDTISRMFPRRRVVDCFVPEEDYYLKAVDQAHAAAILGGNRSNFAGNVNIVDLSGLRGHAACPASSPDGYTAFDFTRPGGHSELANPSNLPGRDAQGWLFGEEPFYCTSQNQDRVTLESCSSLSSRFLLGAEVLVVPEGQYAAVTGVVVEKHKQRITISASAALTPGMRVVVRHRFEAPVHDPSGRAMGVVMGETTPMCSVFSPGLCGVKLSLDGLHAARHLPRVPGPDRLLGAFEYGETSAHGLHRVRFELPADTHARCFSLFVRELGRAHFKLRRQFDDGFVDVRIPAIPEPDAVEGEAAAPGDIKLEDYAAGWKLLSCPLELDERRATAVQLMLLPSAVALSGFYHGCPGRGVVLSSFGLSRGPHATTPMTGTQEAVPGSPIVLGRGAAFVLSLAGLSPGRSRFWVRSGEQVHEVVLQLPESAVADAVAPGVQRVTAPVPLELLTAERLHVCLYRSEGALGVACLDDARQRRAIPKELEPFELTIQRDRPEEYSPLLGLVERFDAAETFGKFRARLQAAGGRH